MRAGVHQVLQQGIAGNRSVGCVSICVNGGYADDEDRGDVILYTGEGGNDAKTKLQVADQALSSSGNAALLKSITTGLPVRVLRGSRAFSEFSPSSGFRYDGLFQVVDHWRTREQNGFWIWQFRLEQMADREAAQFAIGQPVLTTRAKPSGTALPPKAIGTVQRTVRSTAVSRWVKELYDHTCQVCDFQLPTRETQYSEGAHIRALGSPSNGSDVVENVLCLCPNHHVLLDYGAIYISDNLAVYDHIGDQVADLTTHKRHAIDVANLQAHRARFGY